MTMSKLRRLRQQPVETVNWNTELIPQTGFFSERKHLLGYLSLRSETKPFEDVDAAAKLQHIGTIKLSGLGKVTGIISLHGHLGVTHRHDPHIYLYNQQERMASKLLVGELINPCGMESDPHVSGRCVIVDEATLLLHWITVGHSLTIGRHHTRRLGYVPLGVSVGHLGDVIVTGQPNHVVQIYNNKGEQMRDLRLASEMGNQQMAVREGSGFILLDSSKNQVLWFNAAGRLENTYGATEDEALSNPSHIALHPLGYLLVVDKGNSRIHLLGRNRKLQKHVLLAEDGVMKPDRVLWDPSSSLLYVAQTCENGRQEMKIFKSMPDTVNQLTMEMQLFEPQ